MADLDTMAAGRAAASLESGEQGSGEQVAIGTGLDGGSVVVVCTAGVDLDAIALAADTRAVLDPLAELVIAAPRRNLIAPVLAVGAVVDPPARFVALELP